MVPGMGGAILAFWIVAIVLERCGQVSLQFQRGTTKDGGTQGCQSDHCLFGLFLG